MSVMERVVYVMEGVVCVTAPLFYYIVFYFPPHDCFRGACGQGITEGL